MIAKTIILLSPLHPYQKVSAWIVGKIVGRKGYGIVVIARNRIVMHVGQALSANVKSQIAKGKWKICVLIVQQLVTIVAFSVEKSGVNITVYFAVPGCVIGAMRMIIVTVKIVQQVTG